MTEQIKKNKRLFVIFLLGSVIRFGFEGFCYYPYLDDYVQYMYYPSLPPGKVFFGGARTAFIRPLAAFFDIFVWGAFENRLYAAMLCLAVLYGISGVLFYCALSNCGIKLSPFFLIVYGFLPLNTEGTYWVSASSRIAVSLFLISLGAAFLSEYIKVGGGRNFVLFGIFHFLSYWFYEQTAAVSFVLCMYLALKNKKYRTAAVSLSCAAAFALWYIVIGKMGINGARLESVGIGEFWGNIGAALSEIFYIFTNILGEIMINGAVRGFTNILAAPEWIIIIGVFAGLWGIYGKKQSESGKETLVLGAVLFFSAFSPFYITKNMWFNLRNTVPALLGLGMVLDFFVSKIPQGALKVLSAAVLAVFLTVQSAEIADYNAAAKRDYKIASALASEYEKTGSPDLVLKGELPEYLSQSAVYHDHIVTGAALDWGYTGMVRGLVKNPGITVELQTKEPQRLQQ